MKEMSYLWRKVLTLGCECRISSGAIGQDAEPLEDFSGELDESFFRLMDPVMDLLLEGEKKVEGVPTGESEGLFFRLSDPVVEIREKEVKALVCKTDDNRVSKMVDKEIQTDMQEMIGVVDPEVEADTWKVQKGVRNFREDVFDYCCWELIRRSS